MLLFQARACGNCRPSSSRSRREGRHAHQSRPAARYALRLLRRCARDHDPHRLPRLARPAQPRQHVRRGEAATALIAQRLAVPRLARQPSAAQRDAVDRRGGRLPGSPRCHPRSVRWSLLAPLTKQHRRHRVPAPHARAPGQGSARHGESGRAPDPARGSSGDHVHAVCAALTACAVLVNRSRLSAAFPDRRSLCLWLRHFRSSDLLILAPLAF